MTESTDTPQSNGSDVTGVFEPHDAIDFYSSHTDDSEQEHDHQSDDGENQETVFNIDENGNHIDGINDDNEQEQEQEEQEGDGEGEQTVFNIDSNGNHIDNHQNISYQNDEEYDLDFNEYEEPSDTEINTNTNENSQNENYNNHNKELEDEHHNHTHNHNHNHDEFEESNRTESHLESDETDENDENEEIEEIEEHDENDEYDEYDDASPALVVPDIGITRESSIASRITNESDIFANPRKPSVAFPHPSLQTLSEEMKEFADESDSTFISMINSSKTGTSSIPSRSTTIGSTLTSKIPDNSNEFISNARYSQSIMSYDDENDDAFSFQANDDREYEIGYVPSNESGANVVDESEADGDETDTNLTDTESLAHEDLVTPTEETSAIKNSESSLTTPSIPFAPKILGQGENSSNIRDSVINVHELEEEVGAMRNQFVRSDMHPSVMSKMTNVVGFNNDKLPELPKGLAINGIEIGDNSNFIDHNNNNFDNENENDNENQHEHDISSDDTVGLGSDAGSELNRSKSSESITYNSRSSKSTSTAGGRSIGVSSSISGSTKSSTPHTPKTPKTGANTLSNDDNIFSKIPDFDLYQMFINNSKIGDNIDKLKDIRSELNDLDTGLSEWISYNMGASSKINMEDDKLGIHVREAFKQCEDGNISGNRNTFTGITNFGDTMENMAHEFGDFGERNVSKFRDVVKEVKVRKIGQRGKTLLRKLKKVPEFTN